VRYVLCILAALFALAAMAAAGWAMALGGLAGIWERPLGELWFALHPGSLNLIQAVVERYVWAPLWDPGIVSILYLPAVLALGAPAAVLIVLCLWRGR